jgi:hypothetical protein
MVHTSFRVTIEFEPPDEQWCSVWWLMELPAAGITVWATSPTEHPTVFCSIQV